MEAARRSRKTGGVDLQEVRDAATTWMAAR
jgi:hypothetical protein